MKGNSDMSYFIEILKQDEVYIAILLTLAAILYLVIAWNKDKIFKGKASFLGKLFSFRMFTLLLILIIAMWTQLNYDLIKKEAYFASFNPELRASFDELMALSPELKTDDEGFEFYDVSSRAKVNLQTLKSQFKAIAIAYDTIHERVYLEERLNDQLKKNGQYSIDPNSLDYIICFFQQWKTDTYISDGGGSMAFCKTENAFIQIVDQKSHEVVDTVRIELNLNPEVLSVEVNQAGFGSERVTLTAEDLYNYCMRKKEKVSILPQVEAQQE